MSGSDSVVSIVGRDNVTNYNTTIINDPALPSGIDWRGLLGEKYRKKIQSHTMFGMEEIKEIQFKEVFLMSHVAEWDVNNKEPNSIRLKGAPFDLWKNLKQRTALWGKAGAGKSSLCRWIAYDWSLKKPQLLASDIEWVIYVDLAEAVKGLDENATFVSMLHRYWNIKDVTAADVEKFMRHLKNYIVVFDGLDEARALAGKKRKKKRKKAEAFLAKVCNRQWEDIIDASGVLLAGRPPDKAGQFGHGWKELEVIGFGERAREEYVTKMFHNKETEGAARLEQFRNNKMIADLASVPLQLQLICALRLSGRQEKYACAADLLTLAIDEFLWRGLMKGPKPTTEEFDLKDDMMDRLMALSSSNDTLVLTQSRRNFGWPSPATQGRVALVPRELSGLFER